MDTFTSAGTRTWTVPSTRTYKIEAWGGQGGSNSNNNSVLTGGKGSYASGLFYLTQGTVLTIGVGGQGIAAAIGGAVRSGGLGLDSGGSGGAAYFSNQYSGSGGGGSSGAKIGSRYLIVGAGGGGAGRDSRGGDATINGNGSSPYLGGNGSSQAGGGGGAGAPAGNGASAWSSGKGGYGFVDSSATSPSQQAGVQGGNGKVVITPVNSPPGTPGVFSGFSTQELFLSHDVISFSWGASVDTDGDSLTYELSFYNGSTWSVIVSNILTTFYQYTLPNVDTGNAMFRVRAQDSAGDYSSYRTSNVFAVRKHLLLIKEDDTIRTYKGGWKTVTSLTVEQFKEFGMADLSELTEEVIKQLESDNFQILVLTKDTAISKFSLETTAVPKRQLVTQETEMSLPAPIQSFKLTASEVGDGVLRIIVSTDKGTTWQAYNGETWLEVDITNLDNVAEQGMTVTTLNGISEETWKPFLSKLKIRFAYYLDLGAVTDATTLTKLEYTTVPVVNKTPKLTSIKVAYDDLTIEGRLKDLERINAINMAKLNFKSNALLLSEKYEMHDMIVDTFETDTLKLVVEEEI